MVEIFTDRHNGRVSSIYGVAAMRYRVIEDLDAPESERFVVQYDRYGDHWRSKGRYPDQLSAEIAMERLAAGPRVVAKVED